MIKFLFYKGFTSQPKFSSNIIDPVHNNTESQDETDGINIIDDTTINSDKVKNKDYLFGGIVVVCILFLILIITFIVNLILKNKKEKNIESNIHQLFNKFKNDDINKIFIDQKDINETADNEDKNIYILKCIDEISKTSLVSLYKLSKKSQESQSNENLSKNNIMLNVDFLTKLSDLQITITISFLNQSQEKLIDISFNLQEKKLTYSKYNLLPDNTLEEFIQSNIHISNSQLSKICKEKLIKILNAIYKSQGKFQYSQDNQEIFTDFFNLLYGAMNFKE